MKKWVPFIVPIIFLVLVSLACDLSMPGNPGAEQTKNALAVEQTKLALQQSLANQPNQPIINQNQSVTPTFTIPPITATVTFTSPAPSLAPSPTTTLLAGLGFSIYTDDFTDPNSGWPEKTTGDNQWWYHNEHYHIQVHTINTQYVITSGYTMTNGSVTTDGLILDQTGTPQSYYGVVCRYQDFNNYYFFEVSYDGYYRIGKFENGVFSLIGMTSSKFSTLINTGDYNEISAQCLQNELSLTVNGTLVKTVYDNTFTSGDTGLCATAGDVPGIIAAFQYFTAEDY